MRKFLQKYKNVIPFIIIFIGILIKLYLVKEQPLWLDEKFSIYFSKKYSINNLLLGFKEDSHPGGYYVILRILLSFSQSQFFLRFFSSLFFQIAAAVIITLYFLKKKKNYQAAYVSSICFSFYPLFAEQSWQLRMYSLSVLMSAIILIFFDQYLLAKKNKTKKYAFLLISMLIGLWIHYSFLILNVVLLIFLLYKNRNFSKFISSVAILLAFFLLISGYNNSVQFSTISWIDRPSLSKMGSFFITIFGLGFIDEKVIKIIVVGIIITYLILKNKKNSKQKNEFLLLVLAPFLITFTYSLVAPSISRLPVIGSLFPDASLLLPRAHIPYIVLIMFYLEKLINKKKFLAIIFTITLCWSITDLKMMKKTIHSSEPEKIELIRNILEKENSLVFPEVWLIETINLENLNKKFSQIEKVKVESWFLDGAFYQNNKNRIIRSTKNEIMYLEKSSIENLEYKDLIKETLNQNCKFEQEIVGFEKWNCLTPGVTTPLNQ